MALPQGGFEPRMTWKLNVALVVYLLSALPMSAKHGNKTPPSLNNKSVATYDASRDPAKDLQDAIALATQTKKRILLEVGGDWCVYCNIMDTTFDSHSQLRKVRDTYYVRVKINFSKENPNATFLSHYPRIADYPHFFVLDSNGALLHSQPTHGFEHGKNYNAGKIDAFLRKWSQPPRHWLNSVG
jgi:thiol:disulfide interchange protein